MRSVATSNVGIQYAFIGVRSLRDRWLNKVDQLGRTFGVIMAQFCFLESLDRWLLVKSLYILHNISTS